jgi:hypothetical protein
MDYFGADQYKELLDVQDGPAVSIFVGVDRQDIKGKNNQLVFRGQVEQARELLEERYPDQEFRTVEEMMQEWVDDEPFWGNLSRGVAAFFSPEMQRIYRLRSEMPTETVVSDTFHTRPMLRPMLQPDRYFVLALDPHQTRLYEGGEDGLSEVNLFDVPTHIDEVLDRDRPPHDMRNRESSPSSPATSAFHGYGRGKDIAPRHLRKFCMAVDEGITDLLRHEPGPLILACPPRTHAIYREVSDLDNLAEVGLQESFAHISPAEIHKKTWPLAQQAVAQRIDEVLELWERAYGFGSGETDLQQIARRTLMSQVRMLLIEEGRTIRGQLDRQEGAVTIDEEAGLNPNADGPDLLDELAEFVISRGGEAFVVPGERMPSTTGAAAILRMSK